jgi:hypothetical protein
MEGFDQPQNLIKDKLDRLNLRIEEINVDSLSPIKLTKNEIISGLIKSYYGDFTDVNEIFSNIIIQEFNDRTKMVCLLKYDVNEKKIKEIVDLFYSYFGLDKFFRGTTNQKDIDKVRVNEMDLPLREWIYDDYVLRLKTDLNERLLMFWIVDVHVKMGNQLFLH